MNPAAPLITARGVQLRPLVHDDIERLRVAEFLALGTTWRARSSTPSPAQYEAMVWNDVLTQVLAIHDGDLVAWLQLYHVELEHGIGYLGAARFGDNQTAFGVAAALFTQYIFAGWNLHKLYLEVPDYHETKVQGLVPAVLQQEGRMLNRLFSMGGYRDVLLYAVCRSTWEGLGIERFLGPSNASP